ncbi:hypothetical protein ACIQF6_15135 [Kitasatospora sp. NPDC092948]|uniref:hypothetical protein n=1 Tax=Kitasatospora sp. NPDC092948 TaxID=3364088 RepID=UPI0037FB6C1B
MSADRCPSCGTAGPAGSCACPVGSPAEQTAVLPPLDGRHLVRPYVADTPVVEPGDPFATRVAPPLVQPITPDRPPTDRLPFVPPQPSAAGAVPPPAPGRPPHVPQAAVPFAPPPDAATQLLPTVPPQGAPQGAPGRFVQTDQGVTFPLGRVVPPPPQQQQHPQQPQPHPQPEPPTALIPPVPAGPEPATALLPPIVDRGADLGMFRFHDDDEPHGPVSRTERREQQRRSADRKRLVIAGGAVGVTALAVSLAMVLSSSPDSTDRALPAPTAPAVASSAESTPSAPPSADPSPDASESSADPSPTRTSARPSPTVTTQPAAAPPAPATTPPAPTSAPPAGPSPSPSTGRTLRLNDTGPEVVQLQRLLAAATCRPTGWLDERSLSGQPLFGLRTQSALASFQRQNRSQLKGPVDLGVYDPQTQALLQSAAQNPDC